MKASDWLKEYQVTGKVPEEGTPEFAFWMGWMIGPSHTLLDTTLDDRRAMAIKAAEFIEAQK